MGEGIDEWSERALDCTLMNFDSSSAVSACFELFPVYFSCYDGVVWPCFSDQEIVMAFFSLSL